MKKDLKYTPVKIQDESWNVVWYGAVEHNSITITPVESEQVKEDNALIWSTFVVVTIWLVLLVALWVVIYNILWLVM